MTYTTTSPAVRRAITTYSDHGLTHLEALAAVLTEHKRGLQLRLAQAEQGRDFLADERDALAAEVAALKARPAAVVLPEITDDDVDAFRCAYYREVRIIPWGDLSDYVRKDWRRAAHILLARRTLAAYRGIIDKEA